MPGPERSLREAFLRACYEVELGASRHVMVRPGAPLPSSLRMWLGGDRHWAMLTAWNPRAKPRGDAVNQRAQARLERLLTEGQPRRRWLPARSSDGRGGWVEPQCFVAGLAPAAARRLARRFDQRAYLHGEVDGPVKLRLRRQPAWTGEHEPVQNPRAHDECIP